MPDGRTVLLTAVRNGRQGIYKQALASAIPEPLVSGPDSYDMPVVSPDREWLLYTETKNDGGSRLMRMPLGGGPATPVRDGNFAYKCSSAYGNGCVLSEMKENRRVFYRLDPLKGRGPEIANREVIPTNVAYLDDWGLSPDGKRIAILEEPIIRIVQTDGGPDQILKAPGWLNFQTLVWSADGRSVYITCHTGREADWTVLEVRLSNKTKALFHLFRGTESGSLCPGHLPTGGTSCTRRSAGTPMSKCWRIFEPLEYLRRFGRARVMMGDKVSARKSYEDFLTLWKDADPDIPIYKQAKAEYAKLH